MFDHLLYSQPPEHTPTKSSARTSTIWTGVLLFTFLRKIAAISSETILFHVMPLQNDRSLSKLYKMGRVCSYFLASHASKGLAPRLRRIYLRAFIHFLFPHRAPTKREAPVETAIIWFVFFVISCAYSHIAEDTPREVLKRKFEFKVILSICVVFLFPRPPSCDIMPLQNDRFPSKGMFVLNTAFVGRQLDFLSLPPCKKRYGKIRWPDMLGHRIFPCWCSSEFFRLFLEI